MTHGIICSSSEWRDRVPPQRGMLSTSITRCLTETEQSRCGRTARSPALRATWVMIESTKGSSTRPPHLKDVFATSADLQRRTCATFWSDYVCSAARTTCPPRARTADSWMEETFQKIFGKPPICSWMRRSEQELSSERCSVPVRRVSECFERVRVFCLLSVCTKLRCINTVCAYTVSRVPVCWF